MPASRPVKRLIKRSLNHIAASLGPHTRKGGSGKLLVLMYHRILPAGDSRSQLEEPGMVVTPATFKLHLEIIRKYFEVVHLSEWLALRNDGASLPGLACAITFDDGWADNYEFAFPILKELHVPATIFLVSDMIGTNRLFWPERLMRIVSSIPRVQQQDWSGPEFEWIQDITNGIRFEGEHPSRTELSQVIAHAKQYSDREMNDRLDAIEDQLNLRETGASASLLDWNQVNEMSSCGLVETGSHTCHHTRLGSDLSESVLVQEISKSKQAIELETGKEVRSFCFPNGDYSPRALELVRRNYEGAVTTDHGWNNARTDCHLLKRIGLHEDVSTDEVSFLGRISGWV